MHVARLTLHCCFLSSSVLFLRSLFLLTCCLVVDIFPVLVSMGVIGSPAFADIFPFAWLLSGILEGFRMLGFRMLFSLDQLVVFHHVLGSSVVCRWKAKSFWCFVFNLFFLSEKLLQQFFTFFLSSVILLRYAKCMSCLELREPFKSIFFHQLRDIIFLLCA